MLARRMREAYRGGLKCADKLKLALPVVLILLAVAGQAWGAYNWYYTDALTSVNPTYWTQNGSVTAGSTGITSATTGSLISTVSAPSYPNDYQVNATINLPNNTSGGNYGIMFRATSNASTIGSFSSFYLLEVQNPVFSNGTCTATLVLQRWINGAVATLYSGTSWCSSSFTIGVTVSGSGMVLFVNRQFVTSTGDTGIATGQPGVSVRNAPAGNTIGLTSLGVADKTPPNSVDRNNIWTSSYSNRIDMQWKGAADDADGSGIAITIIYRGSSNVAGFASSIAEFTDNTILPPSTAYSYNIISCDMFYNCSNSVFNVTTAPANSVDPRQVGLRPTSTNWGGGGENINILSGNLNFSLPLLSAKGRGGMGLGIGLNYNSQNWREDAGGVTWNYGRDIGYGYGFRIGAGSIQQFVGANWQVDHWTFTDSSGAEYRLDRQVTQDGTATSTTSGIWATTTDGATFLYNSSTNRLYFPSGMFWQFDCASLGNEGDYSARYPTLMQDSNGNQILIRYKPGVLAVDSGGNNVYLAWGNSSGRIDQIEDVRAVASGGAYVTYQFNYQNDSGVPHLQSITNNIQTSEGYSFTYNNGVALTSPWGSAFGATTQLAGITIAGISLGYTLSYDASDSYGSALTKVQFPYGGYVRWQYGDGSYSGGRVQKEVMNRYTWDGVTLSAAYAFNSSGTAIVHDSNNTMRQTVTLNDAGGVGRKIWNFNTSGAFIGLLSLYKGGEQSGTVLQQVATTWSNLPMAGFAQTFGPYISSTTTTMDPGGANAAKQVDQSIDQWGNLLTMKLYNSDGSWRRTYTSTYLSTYGAQYIPNRLVSSTVLEGYVTTTLVTNQYDGDAGSMPTLSGPREFDSTYTTAITARGNLTKTQTLGAPATNFQHDNAGNTISTWQAGGLVTSAGTSSTTNYAVPSAITAGSLTSNFTYASDLAQTSMTDPNLNTSTTVYDQYARPTWSKPQTGAPTYFNYVNSPAQVIAFRPSVDMYGNLFNGGYTAGAVTRTTLDGFGRGIKVESGPGSLTYSASIQNIAISSVVSQVDSVYAPCGCSPMGKLTQTSRPHVPGATVYWTTNTYDGIGRTKSVQAPDSSTSTYLYSGATVTTTDPAGKWKKFLTDAAGNLTQVNEPNPAGGADFLTNYVYDVLDRLGTVSMPRSNGTQTRKFNYTGALMTSTTNPENGTVFNYYNPTDQTLSYKIDAKGQMIAYAYDQYKRVTEIAKFPDGFKEDICQRVTYNYDTNPDISSYPYNSYLLGRMTSVHYGGAGCQTVGANSLTGNNYVEMYAYSQAGQVTNKRLRLARWTGAGGLGAGNGTFSPIYASPSGSLDSGTCSGISGWAADLSRLNQSVSMSLYAGGQLVSRMKASALRSDVGAYLGDNGLHGFTVSFR